jgi:hypothetical protein
MGFSGSDSKKVNDDGDHLWANGQWALNTEQ